MLLVLWRDNGIYGVWRIILPHTHRFPTFALYLRTRGCGVVWRALAAPRSRDVDATWRCIWRGVRNGVAACGRAAWCRGRTLTASWHARAAHAASEKSSVESRLLYSPHLRHAPFNAFTPPRARINIFYILVAYRRFPILAGAFPATHLCTCLYLFVTAFENKA